MLSGGIFCATQLVAQSSDKPGAKERAARTFQAARARYNREMDSAEAAWQFARACFDWAELATNTAQRAETGYLGIAAGRRAVTLDPKLAAAHYYLAMNLGELAQTKTLGALKMIDEIEREFKAAWDLDARFDYAGPERNLGLLYLNAPGWPMSIGNRNKARQHLQKTVELSPDYPDGWLSLLEAELKWGEKRSVQSKLSVVEKVMATARTKLAGDDWELSWADWDSRWEKIKSKAGETVKPLESPKQRN